MPRAGRHLASLALVEAAAIAAVLALHSHSELQVDWSDLGAWVHTKAAGPAVAALVFHALALATLWLVVTTVGYAAARLARLPSLAAAVGPLTLPRIRAVIDRAVAATAAAAVLSIAVGAPGVAQEPAGVVPPGNESVGYVPVPAGFPSSPPPAPPPPADTSYEVRPGDSFWRIAVRHAGREEVGAYWRRLVAANVDRIRSGNPDLIYPGEVIVLPPQPGA